MRYSFTSRCFSKRRGPIQFGAEATGRISGKRCLAKKASRWAALRNASTPPGCVVESAPVMLPARALSSGLCPESHAARKPALKLSPAPMLSRASTGTEGIDVRRPPYCTSAPSLPHFTAIIGTIGESASSASATVARRDILHSSSRLGRRMSISGKISWRTPPQSPDGSSFVSSETVSPRDFRLAISLGSRDAGPSAETKTTGENGARRQGSRYRDSRQ